MYILNKAIQYLKDNYVLPDTGFLAGGAIANVAYSFITGSEPVINDIDIFVYTEEYDADKVHTPNATKTLEVEEYVHENGMELYRRKTKTISFYQIVGLKRENMLNYIYYYSDRIDYDVVLENFDLNCVQLGYDLEKNIFHYTKEFSQFLKDGKILINNITSPNQTLLRLFKKRDEMGAKIPITEINICGFAVNEGIVLDRRVSYFKDGYLKIWQTYEQELKPLGFYLSKEIIVTDNKQNLYQIKKHRDNQRVDEMTSQNLIYLVRNDYLRYQNILILINGDNYFDREISDDEYDLITFITHNFDCIINNLIKHNISNQLNLINKLLTYVKPEVVFLMYAKYGEQIFELDEETYDLYCIAFRHSSKLLKQRVLAAQNIMTKIS